jgi:hypothetical protein
MSRSELWKDLFSWRQATALPSIRQIYTKAFLRDKRASGYGSGLHDYIKYGGKNRKFRHFDRSPGMIFMDTREGNRLAR